MGGIVNVEGGSGEAVGATGQLNPFVLSQFAFFEFFAFYFGFRRQKAINQFNPRHFERKKRHTFLEIDRGIASQTQYKSGFTHTRSRRDNVQASPLPARGQSIQFGESGGDSR